ncbi:hypothetical protein [Archangium sp.]|uniref:hypothetical protein n=1 Tax=Archangium sp. TaxID=1872627 RepID=UPI002D59E897|nr:hypothetical protein [Archangium sp.]HYO52367.1 hypothetical protein [Archangium sp.]
MRYLATHIELPPGLLSSTVVRELLRLGLEQYRWFVPMRYGTGSLEEKLDPKHINFKALLSFYEENERLCIAARTDQDFLWLSPARPDSVRRYGSLILETSPKCANKPDWRAAHIEQVTELMRLLNSPLAFAGLAEDIERKTERLVPEEVGQRLDFTVKNYSEGLAGLFWRNFFGPPFVRMFDERLASLPAEHRQNLGHGLVLVQPYELASEAGTEHGDSRERKLIAHLGPECFYDHVHHLKPARLPLLETH